jgi:hypothetical protein
MDCKGSASYRPHPYHRVRNKHFLKMFETFLIQFLNVSIYSPSFTLRNISAYKIMHLVVVVHPYVCVSSFSVRSVSSEPVKEIETTWQKC